MVFPFYHIPYLLVLVKCKNSLQERHGEKANVRPGSFYQHFKGISCTHWCSDSVVDALGDLSEKCVRRRESSKLEELCWSQWRQVRASPVKCELRVMTQETSFNTTGLYVASKHQQSQRRKTTWGAEHRGIPNWAVGTRFESGVH